jgi:hypothetical protein
MLPISRGPRAVESDTRGEISGLADEEICYVVVGGNVVVKTLFGCKSCYLGLSEAEC